MAQVNMVKDGIWQALKTLSLVGIFLAISIGLVIGALTFLSSTSPPKLPPEPHTPPLDFSGFNAERIIDNEEMTQASSLNEKQIQDFLNRTGKGCRPGKSGGETIDCLKDYRFDSRSVKADRFCKGFAGKTGDNVASVIAKTAHSCGINPKVLLVTLQKEQGLLTASSYRLTPRRYEIAMGYACPDNASCDPHYKGIDLQIYYAARQLKRYRADPESYDIIAGQINEIAYGPGSQCKRKAVKVENWATAALYNYTPYIPDIEGRKTASAPCSQLGNANFYAYYRAWFNAPSKTK